MSTPYSNEPPPPPPPPHPPQSYTPEGSTPLPFYQPPRPPKPSSPAPHHPTSAAPAAPLYPPPPPIDPNFLPPGLADKSLPDLKHLVESPDLLNAYFKTTHPVAAHAEQTLTTSLSQTEAQAHRLLSLESTLASARAATDARLRETKALEQRWREKEKEMYQELKRWSEVGLYSRLVNAVAESEDTAETLEKTFLSAAEKDEEVKIEDFVKDYIAVRKLGHLRKERKQRWDEGRIGGWR